MGKKPLKMANNLGLTKLRLTVLYARARKIRMTFTKYIPDVTDAIRDYITMNDPDMVQDRSGGGRNNSFYYLSTKLQLFVWVADKAAGFTVANPSNHAIQVNIYCENDDLIRGLAHAMNNIYVDANGLLEHMDWRKIEKKFKVNQKNCIEEWERWLSQPAAAAAAPTLTPTPAPPGTGKICTSCGADNPLDANFCQKCGASI